MRRRTKTRDHSEDSDVGHFGAMSVFVHRYAEDPYVMCECVTAWLVNLKSRGVD